MNGYAATEPSFTERLKALWQTIKDDMQVVVIDLDDNDDAQVIFETLNALGTPLLPADLIKNFLFQSAELKSENLEALYEKYWNPFDRDSAFWREEVRQGRLNRPRIDLFLQHYLTLMKGDEVCRHAPVRRVPGLGPEATRHHCQGPPEVDPRIRGHLPEVHDRVRPRLAGGPVLLPSQRVGHDNGVPSPAGSVQAGWGACPPTKCGRC